MAETYDLTERLSAPKIIPLSTAAALCMGRLIADTYTKGPGSNETLNLAAVSISAIVPIYKRDPQTGMLARISEAELAAGRFAYGATRLCFDDGRAAVELLAVRVQDAELAIDTIARTVAEDKAMDAHG